MLDENQIELATSYIVNVAIRKREHSKKVSEVTGAYHYDSVVSFTDKAEIEHILHEEVTDAECVSIVTKYMEKFKSHLHLLTYDPEEKRFGVML